MSTANTPGTAPGAAPGGEAGPSTDPSTAELAGTLLDWLHTDRPFALALVVQTWSSAPRPAGALMAVAADGQVVGSLSGGCVEGAVHELALDVQRTGGAALAHYGVSDDDAFAVGLACGGKLDVLVTALGPGDREALAAHLAAGRAGGPSALAVRLPAGPGEPDPAGPHLMRIGPGGAPGAADSSASPGAAAGTLGDSGLDARIGTLATDLIGTGATRVLQPADGPRVLVTASAAQPRLIVFGAIDYAAALAELGRFLGYRVTVCDARAVFATAARFPAAHEVVVAWPHRYLAAEVDAGRVAASTVVAVLTHDLKFDVPVLAQALASPAAYIGALGSRRTHALRVQALAEAGVAAEDIARIHAPIGLDLGARTPQATAVSIFAEVIGAAAGHTGGSLKDSVGPIH
ncbi:XdhC family protein [Brevibacterium sp. 50QC2O2]|uniref:XdhC family protein n=1 Tax=Brevibacterium sp. 50QC2O2 TaxID=2968459 RepID=UPI00211BDCBB|nr:XdhC/CoxI family protein [Brevibacterium sp. 50QC2O2]MCQ9388558.1 XdhC family protein [Brevibacterium sp. 50QC2O2]